MYQTYSRAMAPPPPPVPAMPTTTSTTTRRNPLGNAVNHQVNQGYAAHGQAQAQAQAYAQPHAHKEYQHTAAAAHHHHQQKEKEKEATPPNPPPKAPASPPLPRQNSKTAPPSPPKVIMDKTGRMQFQRVGFLGEGGFARVYEVKDPRGFRLACKVVTKSSLKTKKAKTKLYAEIKIHRSLEHPNIVHFQDCFEDTDNVYMTLELCTSGSLMDMLRRRRRFTEPEARFFMVQLIGACHYMHAHQVIHRDLKLGNLFLDGNMNVKVGDFGLAALIENEGERKKTICGTPNYIAPEVLFDTANGHSFEVDTWSVGVILYTLVVGRPPFQTKDVKAIYKRIRDNEYEFPQDRLISSAAQHLISLILTPDPSQRPTLHEIVDHAFFTHGPVPAYIPTSAHDGPPNFGHVSRAASEVNLKRLRKYSMLDVDYSAMAPVASSGAGAGHVAGSGSGSGTLPPSGSNGGIPPGKTVTTSIAQQEKEFQKAVQPGSPISALLSSARQPLVMGTSTAASGPARDSPLLRKLQAAAGKPKESPLGRRSVTRGLDGIVEESGAGAPGGSGSTRRRMAMSSDDGDHEEEEMRLRKKELEAQKARIVAQMAPVREEGEENGDEVADGGEREDEVEIVSVKPTMHQAARQRERMRERYGVENVAPAQAQAPPPPVTRQESKFGSASSRTRGMVVDKENMGVAGHSAVPVPAPSAASASVTAPAPAAPTKPNGFEAAAHTLTLAFDARASGRVFRDPRGVGYDGQALPLPDERVFIVSWVDYCNKYGMGYALTDGSVGVHFNDSTSLVLSPDKVHFDYISARQHGSVYVRKSYTADVYPEELKSKVYLLKHFERYIMDRLYGEYEYTFEDTQRERGMEWVQKYLRMKHVIVFKLSHDVLQFNFYDHSKLILSSNGLLVTHIDKHYKMTRWSLHDIMVESLALSSGSSSAQAQADPEHAKFMQRLVDKLKYCKEVLVSIRTASAAPGGTGVPEESEAMGRALMGGEREREKAPQVQTMGRAGSKMSGR
ncbi:hypothetical protein GALMADRAFT_103174 [Galerina marginata CBS 339.88]|uniref:Serine/threonine-protein kinase n=1 Tax=Galerina marginata (strain CBS 339.88) TaxID=685588 RepID=A0A067SRT9_GALM3|nr:hypothetical protein GALMADRAFT_103174 [Galerina marginata CBS 339.88]